ncbi:TM2 domain-containing protein [Minwuia thermotolerans]|uniref:TM2 domain-containing protein n=1 Tax=Minwuia thermotolerans TaxID=2056226 RepID=A0A2M9FZ59_9PROT|nr:NINE protein [Minwuia thermotolerans]PJK28745.1 TM2 domain-containing protein [Minwuia thermotolerans]
MPTDARFPDPKDETASARYQANVKSIVITYLLWFFLGWLALHRFYLGRWVSGLIMLLMWAAGSGLAFILIGYFLLIPWAVWWFLDLFLIPGMVRAENNAVVDRIERGY